MTRAYQGSVRCALDAWRRGAVQPTWRLGCPMGCPCEPAVPVLASRGLSGPPPRPGRTGSDRSRGIIKWLLRADLEAKAEWPGQAAGSGLGARFQTGPPGLSELHVDESKRFYSWPCAGVRFLSRLDRRIYWWLQGRGGAGRSQQSAYHAERIPARRVRAAESASATMRARQQLDRDWRNVSNSNLLSISDFKAS